MNDDDLAKLAGAYSTYSAPTPVQSSQSIDPAFAGVDPSLLAGMEYDPVSSGSAYNGPVGAVPVTSKEVDSMKNLLSKLNDLGQTTASSVASSARHSRELAEAIHIQRKPDRVVFDNKYEIRIVDENAKKRFDVVDSYGMTIAESLFLYESAYAIVKLLNKGVPALDPRIRQIVVHEEQYGSARADAMRFKKRHAIAESAQRDIYAAKYQKARDNALEAKHQVQEILKRL